MVYLLLPWAWECLPPLVPGAPTLLICCSQLSRPLAVPCPRSELLKAPNVSPPRQGLYNHFLEARILLQKVILRGNDAQQHLQGKVSVRTREGSWKSGGGGRRT